MKAHEVQYEREKQEDNSTGTYETRMRRHDGTRDKTRCPDCHDGFLPSWSTMPKKKKT